MAEACCETKQEKYRKKGERYDIRVLRLLYEKAVGF